MSVFILVHGSFHAAWNWHKVVPLLEQRGSTAIALDMPGHGLDAKPPHQVTLIDCVDRIGRCLDTIDGKVILVAHSRNGMVISQAAEAYPQRVERLVYLAAYLVPNGKSMMDYAVLDTESLVFQNVLAGPSRHAALAAQDATRHSLRHGVPNRRRPLTVLFPAGNPDRAPATRMISGTTPRRQPDVPGETRRARSSGRGEA